MKTVLYMGCDFPSGNAAAIRVASNAFALNEYGFNVIVLSFDHLLKGEMVEKYADNFTVVHVQYPINSIMFMKYLISISAYSTIIEGEKGIDLVAVITYDQPAISFIRLKRYCKKRKIVLICDCAEWHTTAHLKGIAKIVKAADISLAMRYAYKKADGIIAISSYLEDYYKKAVKVIRIPPLQYQERSGSVLSASHKRKFIYAGTVGKDKDRLDIIINAFENVEGEFSVHIFGLSEEEFTLQYKGMREKISKIRKKSELKFWGYVSHDVILKELEEADFTLLIRNSSRKNNAGFPTKLVECVNYGVPIVASEFSDVKYYIDKYGFGLMCENLDNLAETLQEAVNIPDDKLLSLKQNCINYRGFYYKTYVGRLGDFISKLVRSEEF